MFVQRGERVASPNIDEEEEVVTVSPIEDLAGEVPTCVRAVDSGSEGRRRGSRRTPSCGWSATPDGADTEAVAETWRLAMPPAPKPSSTGSRRWKIRRADSGRHDYSGGVRRPGGPRQRLLRAQNQRNAGPGPLGAARSTGRVVGRDGRRPVPERWRSAPITAGEVIEARAPTPTTSERSRTRAQAADSLKFTLAQVARSSARSSAVGAGGRLLRP